MSQESEMDETFRIVLNLIKNKGYSGSDFKFEEKKRDITVRTGDEIDFIIEMKRDDVALNMQHVMQAIRYGQRSKTRIVIITNGKDWLFYDSLTEAQIDFGPFQKAIPNKKDLEAWKKGVIDWELTWEDHGKVNKLGTTSDKVAYLVSHPELSPILQKVPHRGSYDWAILLEYLNAFCGINIPTDIIEKIVKLSQPSTKSDPEHIPPADTIRRVFYKKHKTDIIPQAISGRNKQI